MNLIYSIFKLDKNSREGVVSATSILSIIVNLLVALLKVVVGIISGSIAIISEGINNATDALSSFMTLIGIKLSNRKPDAKHPFGYGRIEYLTNIVIGAIIIYSGISVLGESISKLIHPEQLNVSVLSIVLVGITALIKYLLGTFTINQGKKVNSESLVSVGIDCRNDVIVSFVSMSVAAIYLVSNFNIDGIGGIFTSYLIIKAGSEILSSTISELLGQPADEELARVIYKDVREVDGVVNAADLILHNYGPDNYSGSINVEVDHKMSASEIFKILRPLQVELYKKYNVALVIGIYAVDNDSEDSRILRERIVQFARSEQHIKSYHAVYSDSDSNMIYCDLVLDYEADKPEVYHSFYEYLKNFYPDKEMQINIDTEFV